MIIRQEQFSWACVDTWTVPALSRITTLRVPTGDYVPGKLYAWVLQTGLNVGLPCKLRVERNPNRIEPLMEWDAITPPGTSSVTTWTSCGSGQNRPSFSSSYLAGVTSKSDSISVAENLVDSLHFELVVPHGPPVGGGAAGLWLVSVDPISVPPLLGASLELDFSSTTMLGDGVGSDSFGTVWAGLVWKRG